jgi:hypothetical protein
MIVAKWSIATAILVANDHRERKIMKCCAAVNRVSAALNDASRAARKPSTYL